MPKLAGLLTEWLTIGTSGPTVDGRTIKPEWLEQAAEMYDPAEYTAVANAEHWFGNYGTVRELRAVEDKKGRTALQARIRPNKYYLMQNSEDKRLFFSMELQHNFAKTGKTYLTGLATTDNPASLGTSEAHFSREDNAEVFRGGSEEFSADALKPAEDRGSDKNIVAGVIKGLKEVFSNHNNKEQKEDFSMTEVQFNEFKEGQDALLSAVKQLGEDFKSGKSEGNENLNNDKSGEGSGKTENGENLSNGKPGKGSGKPENKNDEKFAKLQGSVDKLCGAVTGMTEKLGEALEGKFGKNVPPNKGSETDAEADVL